MSLQVAKKVFTGDLLVVADHAEDCCERSDSYRLMSRNWKGLAEGIFGPQDDVTSGLLRLFVAPVPDKMIGKGSAVEVSRYFHATESTCSTWRKRRI